MSRRARIRASAVGCLGALLLAGTVTPASPASAAVTCVDAAHRGGQSQATENSLRALRSAVTEGADYLEMDVQVTSDGTFVLMHDRTIDRTTTGTGRVIDLPWARLRAVRLTDGQGVPTLARVLAMARRTHVKVLVELKWVPSRRFAALRAMLGRFGLGRVVVNSFSTNVVGRWHDRYPGMRTALDTNTRVSVARARSFGGVMPDHRHVTLPYLARLRRAGVATYLWTVNKPADWARYRGRVTLLLTDRPAVYDAWRRRHC